jgi:hypothetical protein
MSVSTEPSSMAAVMAARARSAALLALPFQVATVILALVLNWVGAEVELVLTLLILPVYWIPLLVEIVFRTSLPWPLQLSYLIFTAAGPFAGSALHVYWYIPRWDGVVHFFSGIMLAWLGMLLARRAEERLGLPLPRWFSLTMALFTAMAFAGAWEICEFLSDLLLGTAAQHGLGDSMWDIIAGTLGGVAAIILLLLARRPRSLAPESLLARRS